jgi:hypothetical protein
MPKHDFGSPKDIANRIKAKGLQKLRWFCQMCQKQCRDENGFKCHLTSVRSQYNICTRLHHHHTYFTHKHTHTHTHTHKHTHKRTTR